MGQIDVGRAATAGFGVMARNPLAVLVWALVLFALIVLPLVLVFAALGPAFVELIQSTPVDGEPDLRQMMRLQGQMIAMNSLAQLGQLVGQVLLMCAVYRAVLSPDDKRFFYLRLGMAEVMAGATLLFVIVLLVIGALGAVLVVALVAAGAAAASTEAAVMVAIAGGLAIAVGLVWIGLRLSLATVMSFADRSFRLVEAWRLTRGKVGTLFLVGLLLVVIIFALQLVFGAVLGGMFVATIAVSPPDETALQAFFAQPVGVWAAKLAPWVLGGGLVFSLLATVSVVLTTAPWAAAYRDLAPRDEGAAAFA